jgi:Mg-chelatase subunit ChlI
LQEGLAEKLPAGEVPRKIREAPFVQIPLGVTEDRLVGTVDIEASMKVRPYNLNTHFDIEEGFELWTHLM